MDVIREVVEEERKYFDEYRKYAKKIKEIVKTEFQDVKVLVFGSVVEGKHTPSSDIDVLVISDEMPKSLDGKAKIRAKILKEIGVESPFEIHLVNSKEFEWYKRFIKKFEEI